jgi:hypothetical protein
MTRQKLQKNLIHKVLKFFYVAFCTISLMVLVNIQFEKRPKVIKTINLEKSSIICQNNKIYPIKEIRISIWQDQISGLDDQNARILCKNGYLDFAANKNQTIEKNYNYSLVQNQFQFGSWKEWFFASFIRFFILTSTAFLIGAAFFYLTSGFKKRLKFF